jgi:multiple sugar transport system substrate-binding protein
MKRITALCAAAFILSPCTGKTIISVEDALKNHEITGEITVSCYNSADFQTSRKAAFLDEAAKAFEFKFPGTKVNIEPFGKMPQTVTRELNGQNVTMYDAPDPNAENDYKYKTAAALMAGRGADVYLMDVLPVHRYYEGGFFDNLREYMTYDPEFDPSKYRENLFDALTNEHGMFIMPIDYSFSFFAYNADLFTEAEIKTISALGAASYETLAEMAKEAFDRQNSGGHIYMFKGIADKGMFYSLFYQNYTVFIDNKNKKANFTDGRFTDMLNTVREYADAGYIKSSADASAPMSPEDFNSSEEWWAAIRMRDEEKDYFFR